MERISNILVIDDDQEICDFVGEILTGNGYIYDFALNARDAFTKMQNHFFDIILLDVKLPDKSGIDLLELSQSSLKTTSIIMMTAVKDFNTVIQAMKMGASDYIVKPFTIDKLNSSIAAVMKNRKAFSSASTKPENMWNIYNNENSPNKSIQIMDAISVGVDAQVEYYDFHSKIVTQKTVHLARQLGLPINEIDIWENTRNEQYSKKERYLYSILCKLKRNPLAKSIFKLTKSVNIYPRSRIEWN